MLPVASAVPLSDVDVVIKATVRAADRLRNFEQDLARILGVSEATISE